MVHAHFPVLIFAALSCSPGARAYSEKSLDFFDSGMLQRFEAERFLIAQMESTPR